MKTLAVSMYEATANSLVERIEALIPEHPEILKMKEAFDLFDVKDFSCDDLNPSLAQAQWALSKAKHNYNSKPNERNQPNGKENRSTKRQDNPRNQTPQSPVDTG